MTDSQLASPSRRSWEAWLLATGTLLAVAGVLGGLVAQRSADLAVLVGSTRLLTPGASAPTSSQLALTFEPSPSRFLDHGYALVWVAVAVVLVGLIAVCFGVVLTLRNRRIVSRF